MSCYTISRVAELAGPPITARLLRWWESIGILQPERQEREASFPGSSMRIFDADATIAVMVLGAMRRKGISSAALQKAGPVPRGLDRAYAVIFDLNNFRWAVCSRPSDFLERAEEMAGPGAFVFLERRQAALAEVLR